MDDFDPNALIAFVKQCTANVVRTQEIYDDAFENGAPGAARMRISSYEIEAGLEVSIARSKSFAVRVSPLNLGYRIMRGDTSEAGLRLTVRVEQAAVPAMSNT